MPDLSIAASLLGSFNAAQNIIQSLLHLKSIAEVQGKVVELQSVILSAQSSALAAQAHESALIQRVAALEEEIARQEAWRAERQRYELKAYPPGAFAYALKPDAARAEPAHWICAQCYERGKKSILQLAAEVSYAQVIYQCHACQARVVVTGGFK